MGSTFGFAKEMARRSGIATPMRRWITTNVIDVPFHTLSPDLLVGLVKAFDHQKDHVGKAYYEFGLYQGFSIWFAEQIARGRVPADFKFFGFDSFQGLPSTTVDREFYHAGQFATDFESVKRNLFKFGADWEKIKLFQGFYSEELFRDIAAREALPPVSIAVIDVDIYESCVLVLEFLRTRIVPGSILIFDDYNDMNRSDANGERKAVREFMAKTGMELTQIFELGRECAAFEVTKAPL